MRHVHRCFFDGREVLEIYLLGVGTVGRRLLAQIKKQCERLLQQRVELRVCAAANSRRMLLDPRGLGLAAWEEELAGSATATDLGALCDLVRERRPIHPVLVDCTASEALAAAYPSLFEAGFHVVTANKKANSAAMAFYRELRRTANRWQRKFFYETNVGAGLPVIDTLKNLVKTGDEVIRFDGILSGSMSFILGLLEEGTPLSEAVRTARERGFTEPDPRDDLSGMDVARKVLILAREMGLVLELEDVRIEPLLPPGFAAGAGVDEFLCALPQLDEGMAARIEELAARGEVLRFLGSIAGGGCRVGLEAVSRDHPLAAIRGGENALAFLTQHYQPTPLVVRGYGAGADVTAAGVLADILRLVYWNVED
jgi:aspartokinase/homoserine dehydrogenase 1